ncbi:ABC transporter permease [Bacillus atrophaeus]|uniref:ABC transporter permease n=1 Tax=Bacillus atrophaeus TaxID=1452 RepID=UPI000D027A11|nr:ABC transporter permease [Bacillus atrophaeus]MEC1900674.1 ABC transporter permease [Bacillus atrophaeus]MEC2398219.1 ABC transporter permease [Bacillus atrophaeus]MED4433940.1 ABC transporter permease [Bacillus atrophaeus]MED4564181.1 ABC transporter permease [Bacillus atrophaeus]MED4575447.1 ABC transporter permease [Bacillus atrophaeus]
MMKAAATTAGSLQKTNVSQKRKNTDKNVYGWVKGLVLPFVIIAVWQIAGSMEIVSATVLPTPLVILLTFKDLIVSGELFVHLKISVYRAAAGFLSGAGLGLLIGLLVGFSRKTEHYIDPSLQMLRTVPHLAVTPLFILWFGFDETSKILLIALGAFFPVYINTFLGIRGVDSKLFDVAKVLEFPWYRQMTKLILPAALPSILLGIRLSLGIAWLGLVVAELMGSSEGIGYMIMDARQFSQTNKVFVGIIIFAVVGKLTDSFVRFLERKLLKWRNSYQG